MKNFRECDKVYLYFDKDVDLPPGDYFVTKKDKAGNVQIDNNKTTPIWVKEGSIHHDNDRKISDAVQKAIEENETKPVRKVTKFMNVFKTHNDAIEAVATFYLTRVMAEEKHKTGLSTGAIYILIAQPVEVEE